MKKLPVTPGAEGRNIGSRVELLHKVESDSVNALASR